LLQEADRPYRIAEFLAGAQHAVGTRVIPEAVDLDMIEFLPLVVGKEPRIDQYDDVREQRQRDEREARECGPAVDELAQT
jgi:hypothetical protein